MLRCAPATPTRSSLPIATVLNGLGIAMIYRIDIADRRRTAGTRARRASSSGARSRSSARSPSSLRAAQLPRALPLHLHRRASSASLLLLLPIVPGLGTDANADVWVALGVFAFQPGEIAKIALAIFFAGYLVRTRESLALGGHAASSA